MTIETSPTALTPLEVAAFQEMIHAFYRADPRPFPWRETHDPYAILVSEIMLQQTQVERVRVKYAEFLRLFPDVSSLARAPLQDVLAAWRGLGYNRRAVALHSCTQEVAARYDGLIPASVESLLSLPGIGPYTARAVAAFAFGWPSAFIETNIRTVFIHHFFHDRQEVKDSQILPLVDATLDRTDPRTWYYALMDYGAMLKKAHQNPSRKSAHHVRQSPFKGSNRELRSRILKMILSTPGMTETEIITCLKTSEDAVRNNLAQMEKEGFIRNDGGRIAVR